MITSKSCSRYWELSDRLAVLKNVPAADRGPAFYEEIGKVHYEHMCIVKEITRFCEEWKYCSSMKIADRMGDFLKSHKDYD